MGNMSLIILVNVLMIHSFLRSKFYNNKKIKKKSNMHVMENINESAYIGTKWDNWTSQWHREWWTTERVRSTHPVYS